MRGHGQFGIAEAKARGQRELTRAGFAALTDEVLARGDGTIERDLIPIAAREFDHDDRVGARRHGSASHNLDARRGVERLRDGVASFDFALAVKSSVGDGFTGANGVAITSRAMERRILAVRADFLRQDIAEGVIDR